MSSTQSNQSTESASKDRSFLARYGETIVRGGIASIPSALYRYQGELKLAPQLVWFISAILVHKWNDELPSPSLKRMAEQTGVSRVSLHKYQAELVQAGWLKVINRQSSQGGKDTNYYDFEALFRRLAECLDRDKRPRGEETSPSQSGGQDGQRALHGDVNPSLHGHVNPTEHGDVNPRLHQFEEPLRRISNEESVINFEFEERTRNNLQGNRGEADEPRTPNPRGFSSVGSVLPGTSGIPTGERSADQPTRRVQTDTPAAASHPTGRADTDLPRRAQPTAPGAEQSSGVSDVTPSSKRRQNRILARQVSQPEADSQPPAPSTSSAEEQQRTSASAPPPAEVAASEQTTTDTTAAETEALSGSSAREAQDSRPASRRAAPVPDTALDPEQLAALTYTIEEISAKLGDSKHARSNVTQARRILATSGLNHNAWTATLWSVYHRTAEQKARLKRPAAWFFTALREEVEQRTQPSGHTSLLDSLAEHLAEQRSQEADAAAAPPVHAPLPRETEAHTLWQAVLEDLAQTITRPMFETYLAGTQGVAVENGQLVVSVPSDFTADWLGRKLTPLIRQNIEKSTGIAAGVLFRVEQASATPPVSATLTYPEANRAIQGYS